MADTTRDIELRLRAKDLTNADLKSVIATVNQLSDSLDKQLAAASRLEVKERELKSTLTQLDQAAKSLVGISALIERSKLLSEQVERNQADVGKARVALESHQAAMAGGTATGKAAEASLAGFERALRSAQSRLDLNSKTLADYHTQLLAAGIASDQFATAQQHIATASTIVGDARTKLNNTLRDYPRLEREAKEAALAAAAAQRQAAAATTERAAAEASMRTALAARNAAEKAFFAESLVGVRAQTATQVDVQRVAAADLKARQADATKRLEDFNAKNRQVEIDGALTAFNVRREANQKAVADQLIERKKFIDRRRDEELSIHQMVMGIRSRQSKAEIAEVKSAEEQKSKLRSTSERLEQPRTDAMGRPGRGASANPTGFLGLRPYELTNLGYQVNDVISGLASGQNATQILAQQGGQFLQIFGMAALKWFPLVAAAAGAVAVAVGALTSGLRVLSSNREFTALLTANKYAADQNVESLTKLRRELTNLGVSWEDAGKAITTAVNANIRPEKMREVTLAAQAMAFVYDKTVPEAMTALTKGLSGGVEGFNELIAVYPAIGRENAKLIRDLLLLGKTEEAQIVILKLVGETVEKARKEKLSPLGEEIIKLRTSWNSFIDDLGKSSAFTSLITHVTNLVTSLSEAVTWIDNFAKKFDDPKVQNALKAAGFIYNAVSYPSRKANESMGTAAGVVGDAAGAVVGYVGGVVSRLPGGVNARRQEFEGPPEGVSRPERLTIQPQVKLDSEDLRQLTEAVREASKNLPSGVSRVEITSGRAPRASGTTNHPEGHALDFKLLDDQGNVVPGFMGKDSTGKYAAFATVVKGVVDRRFPTRSNEFESGTQYAEEDAGHIGFRAGGARGARGPLPAGVTTGQPTSAQDEAGSTTLRNAELAYNLSRASSFEEELKLKRAQRHAELLKEFPIFAEREKAVNEEIKTLQEGRNREEYQRKQDNAKQAAEDKRNALDVNEIRAGGDRAVAAATAAQRSNYEEMYRIRKTGEADARSELQRRKQDLDALDGIEKQVDERRRQNLNQQKSALDSLTEAINLRYDNEIKQIEKVRDRSSLVDKSRYDAAIARSEAERTVELGRAPRIAAETQAKEALGARQDLIQTYTKLEATGEITITEKESKIKEAYNATRQAILEAASALEEYLNKYRDTLPETQILSLTARIKELRAETKYIDPFWKGLRDTFTQSFSSGLDTAFNTISEAIGGAIAKTKEWKDVWVSVKNAALNFFASILKEIATYILKAEAAKLASSFLGGSDDSGGSIFGKVIGGVGGLFGGGDAGKGAGGSAALVGTGGLYHSGGVVGRTAVSQRVMPESWWAGAPRYHTGTVVGLAPDEQRAILRRNEEVLSADNPRNVLNGGGREQEINIRSVLVDDPSRIPEAMQSAQGERAIMATVMKNMATIRQSVR